MHRKTILTTLAVGAVFFPLSFFAASEKPTQTWSWGFGRNGQLGLGSQSNISLPQLVKTVGFVDIGAGKSLSAGVTKQGKLFTWGKNKNGVLGCLPVNLNVLVPREVEFKDKVVQVSCGYQTMCVVTDKGEAYVWGLQTKSNKFRSIGTTQSEKQAEVNTPTKINLNGIKQVSCANDYITLVNNQGKVFVMGDLKVRGASGSQAKNKVDILELGLTGIVKISSGIDFSMALNDQGKVFVWGSNVYGQLGTGGLQNANQPQMLQSLIREQVVDISCGDNYCGAVTAKGQVYTWGFGNQGQLGHGDKSDQYLPRKINLQKQIRAISCGGAHTALLCKNNELLMVGRGRQGQLGRQQKDEGSSGYTLLAKQIQQLPQRANILKVACGGNHTLVLLQHLI